MEGEDTEDTEATAGEATAGSVTPLAPVPPFTPSLPSSPFPSSSSYHPPLPPSNRSYGTRSYWNERFSVEPTFDWLVTFSDIKALIDRTVASRCPSLDKRTARVLLVGCGNSPFSYQLYRSGYGDVTSVDYSETVIESMERQVREGGGEGRSRVFPGPTSGCARDAGLLFLLSLLSLLSLLFLPPPSRESRRESRNRARCLSFSLSPFPSFPSFSLYRNYCMYVCSLPSLPSLSPPLFPNPPLPSPSTPPRPTPASPGSSRT